MLLSSLDISNNLGLAILGLALLGVALAGDAGAISGTVIAYLRALGRNPELEQEIKKQWVPVKDYDEDGNEIPLEPGEEPEYKKEKVRNNVKTHPFMNGFVAGMVIEGIVGCFLIGLTIWVAMGIA